MNNTAEYCIIFGSELITMPVHFCFCCVLSTDFWRPIVSALWPQFLPYQLDKNDEHVCSFSASLADVWAAAYYSHTWARVLAADCTQAFIDADQEDWQQLGNRWGGNKVSGRVCVVAAEAERASGVIITHCKHWWWKNPHWNLNNLRLDANSN